MIVAYRPEHFAGVEALWEACFPNDPPYNRAAAAVPAKLAIDDGLFFVAEGSNGEVQGTAMAGYDGHRGWLYAVAVAPRFRQRGIGRALVEHACAELAARGCGKVNLQVRESNERVAAFYECDPGPLERGPGMSSTSDSGRRQASDRREGERRDSARRAAAERRVAERRTGRDRRAEPRA